MQYPARKDVQFGATVLHFVDGSEQRFRVYSTPLHSWVIRLSLLDESELHQLRSFFREHSGAFGSFAFTDPWTGTTYPTCSFVPDSMTDKLQDVSNGEASLTIRENRS
jgi:hypothetical protein